MGKKNAEKKLKAKAEYSVANSTEVTDEDINILMRMLSESDIQKLLISAARKDPTVLELARNIKETVAPKTRIHVACIGPETTEESVKAAFRCYGQVEDVKFVYNKKDHARKDFCFVKFASEDAAVDALKEPSKKIGGRMAFCNFDGAASEDNTPRKIYVSGVPKGMHPEKLFLFFSRYGDIEQGPIGGDKGFVMIVYRSLEGLERALEEPNKVLGGHQLSCCKAADRGKSKECEESSPKHDGKGCDRCKTDTHETRNCKRNAICHYCKKRGHYQKDCKTKDGQYGGKDYEGCNDPRGDLGGNDVLSQYGIGDVEVLSSRLGDFGRNADLGEFRKRCSEAFMSSLGDFRLNGDLGQNGIRDLEASASPLGDLRGNADLSQYGIRDMEASESRLRDLRWNADLGHYGIRDLEAFASCLGDIRQNADLGQYGSRDIRQNADLGRYGARDSEVFLRRKPDLGQNGIADSEAFPSRISDFGRNAGLGCYKTTELDAFLSQSCYSGENAVLGQYAITDSQAFPSHPSEFVRNADFRQYGITCSDAFASRSSIVGRNADLDHYAATDSKALPSRGSHLSQNADLNKSQITDSHAFPSRSTNFDRKANLGHYAVTDTEAPPSRANDLGGNADLSCSQINDSQAFVGRSRNIVPNTNLGHYGLREGTENLGSSGSLGKNPDLGGYGNRDKNAYLGQYSYEVRNGKEYPSLSGIHLSHHSASGLNGLLREDTSSLRARVESHGFGAVESLMSDHDCGESVYGAPSGLYGSSTASRPVYGSSTLEDSYDRIRSQYGLSSASTSEAGRSYLS